MKTSVFDLFSIGIGPSSSHTVGPMRAASAFLELLIENKQLQSVASVKAELFGSLGATGKGHGSDVAVLLGLMGELPETVDTEAVDDMIAEVRKSKKLKLNGEHPVPMVEKTQLILHKRKSMPGHANGMRLIATDSAGAVLLDKGYYSVGGGFVVGEQHIETPLADDLPDFPYPFHSGVELLALSQEHGLSVSTLMLANEKCWRSEEEIREGCLSIWRTMQACVQRGCEREGILPGGLKVKRRAASLHRQLSAESAEQSSNLVIMDWVNLYALAVNEENAAGGRIVTAPTNGAAGVLPAVMHYYWRHCDGASEDGIVRFLLTAAAIANLYKMNASISGAEVGCQGEIGSACSMAAGALTELLGGTPQQVENAAEIGMEHNLGLTCDPVGGLVQVPCIERNAMAAVKAINASRMALRGDGSHYVSLDKVIKTMRDTGRDMATKYKETARGGLAVTMLDIPVTVIEC